MTDLLDVNLPAAIGLFALATGIIGVAGTRLSRVCDRLADRTGLGQAFTGAVLLGAATSLPGITASVTAALDGLPTLALSNAIDGIAAQDRPDPRRRARRAARRKAVARPVGRVRRHRRPGRPRGHRRYPYRRGARHRDRAVAGPGRCPVHRRRHFAARARHLGGRGALTLAVGGVVGSNAFDTLFAAVADVAYRPGSLYHGATGHEGFLIALTIVMTAVLLLGLLRRERTGIARIGFESFSVLVLYAFAIAVIGWN